MMTMTKNCSNGIRPVTQQKPLLPLFIADMQPFPVCMFLICFLFLLVWLSSCLKPSGAHRVPIGMLLVCFLLSFVCFWSSFRVRMFLIWPSSSWHIFSCQNASGYAAVPCLILLVCFLFLCVCFWYNLLPVCTLLVRILFLSVTTEMLVTYC